MGMRYAAVEVGFLATALGFELHSVSPFYQQLFAWHLSVWRPQLFQTPRSSRRIQSRFKSASHTYSRCFNNVHLGASGVSIDWRLRLVTGRYGNLGRTTICSRASGPRADHRREQTPKKSLGRDDGVQGFVRCSPQGEQLWHARFSAVIYELDLDGEEDGELAVSERLHRLLCSDSTRRLLGPRAVIALTSLNFLVVHQSDSQENGDDNITPRGRGDRPRFELGTRRWEVRRKDGLVTGEEEQRSLTDIGSLEQVIQSVAKVTSMTGAWSEEIMSGRHLRRERGERNSSGNKLGEEETLRRRLLRAYAWVRSSVALTRTPVTATATRSAVNPLSVVGMGRLMTPRDCDSILAEAQGSAEWDPWDGDLGEECTARCLEDLPDSRALWDRSAGEIVRARIARNYGVRQSAVVSDTSDVFVCRAPLSDYVRVENEALNLAARVRQHEYRKGRTISADFRRSRSLVTFSIQLSPRDAEIPSWVLCFEQQGRCVMPVGQGSGLIFSGKMRHASLATHFQAAPALELSKKECANDTREKSPLVLLRGFADIRSDVARWGWGRPAWHLNAPWVKDEEILNRVWVASAARGGEDGGRLERMNTSLAHRYYRQGLGGMNVPVVDSLGRPEVDLLERAPKWWIPGSGRGGAEITIIAVLRRRHALDPRRLVIGKAGLSTDAGTSPRMDAALRELFGASREREDGRTFGRVAVPPIKYVFVEPRYRGFGLGKRLFLEAMSCLARRGFRFALIVVEDNGSGSLFDFYEQIGFVRAEEQLGLPRAMIAPIPPPESVAAGSK